MYLPRRLPPLYLSLSFSSPLFVSSSTSTRGHFARRRSGYITTRDCVRTQNFIRSSTRSSFLCSSPLISRDTYAGMYTRRIAHSRRYRATIHINAYARTVFPVAIGVEDTSPRRSTDQQPMHLLVIRTATHEEGSPRGDPSASDGCQHNNDSRQDGTRCACALSGLYITRSQARRSLREQTLLTRTARQTDNL